MSLHAFVAMPFGSKDGINFDKVYSDYLKPALEGEGFEVMRADEEIRAGSIRTDMFQELLLADLVVVDLSIDNPNVWYELGIRHALRARGVIQVQCRRDYMPFDIYTDRALRYHEKNGEPDKDWLERDIARLRRMADETMASWHERTISPVYRHLHDLEEPGWRKFRVDEEREFWASFEVWDGRIRLARKTNRPGDILVLADEAPFYALQVEAFRRAGKELVKLGQFGFALEQIEKALRIDPEDLESRRQKGIILGRLKEVDKATDWLGALAKEFPADAEILALRGRVEKDAWIDRWRKDGRAVEEMRAAALREGGFLRESIGSYSAGFKADPSHYYSGINALTLLYLLGHLKGEEAQKEARQELEGGVRWAIASALSKETDSRKDYWARATMGDLEVLSGDIPAIERAYGFAAAVSDKDWFCLDSSRQQLLVLRDLGFRPAQVEAAVHVFDREIERTHAPWTPRQVILFSGHMIDAPGRPEPRFPAEKEDIASQAISAELAELGTGPGDLALCGGACGGDLLFAEACLRRGARLEVRIPLDEPDFLRESVSFAGGRWQDRYYEVRDNPLAKLLRMPNELGPTPKKRNPFERNNLWQLYSALSRGARRVHFVCLWDGRGGDGPGGTKHLHDSVLAHSGRAHVLETTKLW